MAADAELIMSILMDLWTNKQDWKKEFEPHIKESQSKIVDSNTVFFKVFTRFKENDKEFQQFTDNLHQRLRRLFTFVTLHRTPTQGTATYSIKAKL